MTIVRALASNSTAVLAVRPSYLRRGASTEGDEYSGPRLVAVSSATSDATSCAAVVPLRSTDAATRVAARREALRERYARMSERKWFRQAYEGKSLGEALEVED